MGFRDREKEQMLGSVLIIVGLFGVLGSSVPDPPSQVGTGFFFLLAIAGLVFYCVGRFEHWYHAE